MPTVLRTGLLASTFLIIGFITGWFSKPTTPPGTSVGPDRPVLKSIAAPVEQLFHDPAKPEPMSDVSFRNSAETFVWMKSRHEDLSLSAFDTRGFDTSLALMLGLSPAEVEQLSAAYLQTKKRLDALALHAATGRLSDDGSTLIVSVPSLALEGGALYANLLNTIKQVLGPERYPIFDEIAGEYLDRDLDRFGLNPVTYELTLQPAFIHEGVPWYPAKRTSFGYEANGKIATTMTFGNWPRSSIENSDPVLARFFTPNLGK